MLESYRAVLEEVAANSDIPAASVRLAQNGEDHIELKSPTSAVEYFRPRDPLEVQLVELREDARGVRPLGIRHNLRAGRRVTAGRTTLPTIEEVLRKEALARDVIRSTYDSKRSRP
jgi:hypothetical protein